MSNKSHWKESYPVSQAEEHRVSRRELAKFACMGVAACACAQGVRRTLLPAPRAADSIPVAREGELAPGESKLFKYPTDDHPAILIRLDDGRHVAYSQSCTHLMCPIHFDAKRDQLVCPCHQGFFNPRDGSVISGPPPRALPSFPVSTKNGMIFVG